MLITEAAPLPLHDRDHVLHCQIATLEVYVEQPVPVLLGQIDDPCDMS